MNVREFVADALLQIMDGVRDAQQAYPPIGAGGSHGETDEHGAVNPRPPGLTVIPRLVSFDLSVEATTADGGKGGLRVAAFGVEIGRDASEPDRSHRVSNRISFEVPVTFPFTQIAPAKRD
jgi:hypothetical protein